MAIFTSVHAHTLLAQPHHFPGEWKQVLPPTIPTAEPRAQQGAVANQGNHCQLVENPLRDEMGLVL